MKNLSVILVSGGLDSAVTASIAAEAAELAMLHVNYGQKTEERELAAFTAIADYFKVEKRLVADMRYMKAIGGSTLTSSSEDVPCGDLEREGVPSTYVPFRNAQLLGVAVGWAEAIGAASIYIGAVEEDSSGYPDCRAAFFEAYERMIEQGTRPETCIKIVTPLIDMKKSEIVAKGIELGTPFGNTWSCYCGSTLACGQCDSCLLRLRGFKEAGSRDPIAYKGG
jgi:7-cyano-7-deazaguanine synthase